MTIELVEKAISEQWANALRDIGYATGAIAIFQAYTGLGPKQLKGKLKLLPAFVLTTLLLGIDCRTAGYSWAMTVLVALIGGALVGMPGAKLLHDTAQGVGRRLLGGTSTGSVGGGSVIYLPCGCAAPSSSGDPASGEGKGICPTELLGSKGAE